MQLRATAKRLRRSALAVLTVLALLPALLARAQQRGDSSADYRITAQIQAALYRAPTLASNDISVQVRAGVVYLHGLVDTNVQRDEVEQIARATAGVDRIVDSIELRNEVR